jgi:hypothetical protein
MTGKWFITKHLTFTLPPVFLSLSMFSIKLSYRQRALALINDLTSGVITKNGERMIAKTRDKYQTFCTARSSAKQEQQARILQYLQGPKRSVLLRPVLLFSDLW